jgi:hypothetical protein
MKLPGIRVALCHLLILAASAVIIHGAGVAQTQITLGSRKDNTLYESANGSLSNGAGSGFFAGRTNQVTESIRRGLIAFDIAGNIPSGATISSVTLALNMSQTSSGPQSVELHKLLANWGEGTSIASGNGGSGGSASPGDATWLHTFFSTSMWATPGGVFSSTVSAAQTIGAIGTYTWGSTTQMVSDVQGWLNTPATNFGWLLLGNETTSLSAKRFDTKENPTASLRPKLTVTFTTTAVGEGPIIPNAFELQQNYPNPFNPTTNIEFALPTSSHVTLKVFNILGQEVAQLLNEVRPAGNHKFVFDGSDLASGVYAYQLQAGSSMDAKKMVVMK